MQVLVGFTEADWAYHIGVGEDDTLLRRSLARRSAWPMRGMQYSSTARTRSRVVVFSKDDWTVLVHSNDDKHQSVLPKPTGYYF